MGKIIWFDGKLVDARDARINVLSHSLHYGSGVFEGIRVYETPKGPAIFRLRDHVERLFHSASALGMKIPYTKSIVTCAITKTIAANRLRSCYIRPIVFWGEGSMALLPRGARLHMAVAVWPWETYFPERKPISLCVSRYVKLHPQSAVPGAKIAGFYAASVLAALDAHARGFDECVLLDHEGFVAEGPGENIFTVKGGKLFTPKSPSILCGITRASVIAIARDLHVPFLERKMLLKDLMDAEEIFLAGTAVEISPVGKINGRKIKKGVAGPITAQIGAVYQAAVHGELPRYRHWLTPVH